MSAVCYGATNFLSSFTYVVAYTHLSKKNNRINKVFFCDTIDIRSENLITNSYKSYNDPYNSSVDVSISLAPKTELVKKLLALRKKYLEHGGTLLDLEEIANEVKSRRGGLYNGEADIS